MHDCGPDYAGDYADAQSAPAPLFYTRNRLSDKQGKCKIYVISANRRLGRVDILLTAVAPDAE